MTTPFALLPSQAFCGQGGLGTTAAGTPGGKTVCSEELFGFLKVIIGWKLFKVRIID